MAHIAPNLFESANLQSDERIQAFNAFCDASPQRQYFKTVISPLSGQNANRVRIERQFGQEMYISNKDCTGHHASYEFCGDPQGVAYPLTIGLVHKGEMEIQSNSERILLREGSLYIFSSLLQKKVIGPSRTTFLMCNDVSFLKPISDFSRPLVFHRTTPMGQLLTATVSSVSSAISSNNGLSAFDPVNTIAKDVFRHVVEGEIGSEAKADDASLEESLRSFVLRNLSDTSLSPQDLADFANVSRASLYRSLSGEGGVGSFILSTRLEVARSMLCAGSIETGRVSEIAYLCGFKSLAHFSAAFRKAYGTSPSEVSGLDAQNDVPFYFNRGNSPVVGP